MVDMKASAPKGMNDYLPEEQIVREQIFSTLRKIFRKYGFSPLETPAMESLDVLKKKGAGGAEVGKEVFTLTDRAGRKLGLKFDLTVPLARVLASNPTVPMPFKRYQIERVWRQEFGTRTREFWQCDVDTVGSNSAKADAEFLAIAQDVFKELGLTVTIKYNSRKLLDKVLTASGVPTAKQMAMITEIDNLDKGTANVPAKIINALKSAKVTDVPDLTELSKELRKMGVKATFDPTLARGLDYYTGPVFEVISKEYKSSLAGGGRYDKLLGTLGGRDLPATGISFGVTRIYDLMLKLKKVKPRKTLTQVYVVPIKTDCTKIVAELRKAGICADSDLIGRAPGKNLAYVSKLGIPYALLVGEKELKSSKFVLKDMQTGKERKLNIRQVIKLLYGKG